MARGIVRIAVTLLVVVASATVCRTASGRPSQTTSAPPAGKKFISTRYGYSIVLRGRWVFIPAKLQWDGRFPFGGTGMVDITASVYIDHKFLVSAEPVAPDMTLSEWEAFVEGLQQSYCYGLRNIRATSLGGEPAQEFVNTCPGANNPEGIWRVITLAALHNGRGYLINYLSEPTLKAAAEYRTYVAGRRTFQFTQQ